MDLGENLQALADVLDHIKVLILATLQSGCPDATTALMATA